MKKYILIILLILIILFLFTKNEYYETRKSDISTQSTILPKIGVRQGSDGLEGRLFEDVIFSLTAAKFGKLYVDCSLKLTHFESDLSRPNFSDFYQMWVFNRYFVIRLLKNKKFSNLK